MMGRQRRDQGRLFYEFRLEDRIPENHLLRRINVFVMVALASIFFFAADQIIRFLVTFLLGIH